jgi:hypothetical protein
MFLKHLCVEQVNDCPLSTDSCFFKLFFFKGIFVVEQRSATFPGGFCSFARSSGRQQLQKEFSDLLSAKIYYK